MEKLDMKKLKKYIILFLMIFISIIIYTLFFTEIAFRESILPIFILSVIATVIKAFVDWLFEPVFAWLYKKLIK